MTRQHDADRLDRVLEGRELPTTPVEHLARRAVSHRSRSAMSPATRARIWSDVQDVATVRISHGVDPTRPTGNRRRCLHMPGPGVAIGALVLSVVIALAGSLEHGAPPPIVAAATTASPISWAPSASPVPTPSAFEEPSDV